jgi:hypothetical protein
MLPDFLSCPSLFLGKISIRFQDPVDLFLDFGGESSAGTLNLTIPGQNAFFNPIFDILNPLKIPRYGIPGDIEFFGDSSLGSIEIIEFYNAFDIAHRLHLLNPSRSNDGAGGGIGGSVYGKPLGQKWISLW